MLQMIKNRLKDQRGLTLIELLAVIVILGIIAAIAVPSIMGVINNSREDAVKADAIQILNSAKLHIADTGSEPSDGFSYNDLKGYLDVENLTIDAPAADAKTFVDLGDSTTSSEGQLILNATLTKDGKTLTFINATVGTINDGTAVSGDE